MEENQKIVQIRKLKKMNKKLLNIVPLIEKKVGQKLKNLQSNFYDRCEDYVDGKSFGVSNFFYEWFKDGTMTSVEFMYGVELQKNNFHYVFEKCNIIIQDEVKKFLNFQDFFDFLIKRNKIESPTSQTLPNGNPNGEHNISLKESPKVDSQISSNDETSLNNNIKRNFSFGSQARFN